jgi:hypothetical protein
VSEVIVGVVLTALLGGLLVPIVKGWIDDRRERSDSSMELVDTLATCLWTYWKLALRVAYYGKQGDRGTRGYEAALDKWDSDETWALGNNIQIKVSKSKWLLPQTSQRRLDTTQQEVVIGLDTAVDDLRIANTLAGWEQLYATLMDETRPRIDACISDVIDDLRLGQTRFRPLRWVMERVRSLLRSSV